MVQWGRLARQDRFNFTIYRLIRNTTIGHESSKWNANEINERNGIAVSIQSPDHSVLAFFGFLYFSESCFFS